MFSKMHRLNTLHLCLYLRDSLRYTYGYDTKQALNDEILIHGTRIIEKLLDNRGILVHPKLPFRFSDREGLWQSEELLKELSEVPDGCYDMPEVSTEVLGLIAESSEKAIKCIKPLLKSQKT